MKTVRRAPQPSSTCAVLFTALALIGLVVGPAPTPAMAQTPPHYSITELAGIPQRLNNNGQIAGWVYVGADAHAAIYSHGAWRDLGVPAGDQLSSLSGINSAGAAVGYAFAALPGPDNRWRAIWAPAGGAPEVLSALPLTPSPMRSTTRAQSSAVSIAMTTSTRTRTAPSSTRMAA